MLTGLSRALAGGGDTRPNRRLEALRYPKRAVDKAGALRYVVTDANTARLLVNEARLGLVTAALLPCVLSWCLFSGPPSCLGLNATIGSH